MDRETLRYLADIAAVRGHINNVLGVSRGALQQKVLHQISAKATSLDRLFVDTLLSGRSPGSSGVSVVQQNDDDFVDIAARLQEEKTKLAARTQPQPQPQPQPRSQTPPAEVLTEEEIPNIFDDDVFQPPAEEVAAFEALLAQAESETADLAETEETVVEAPQKKTRKKRVAKRSKKTASK